MKSSSRTIKHMLHLFAVLTIGLSILMAWSVPAAAAGETFTEVSQIYVDFVVDQPCLGEQVHVSGNLQDVMHVTVDPQDVWHIQLINSAPGLTGTGLSSGDTYHAVGSGVISFNFSLDRGEASTSINISYLIGPAGENLYISWRWHVTRSANDQLFLYREVRNISCDKPLDK